MCRFKGTSLLLDNVCVWGLEGKRNRSANVCGGVIRKEEVMYLCFLFSGGGGGGGIEAGGDISRPPSV